MFRCHNFSFVDVLSLKCYTLSLLADYIKQCCQFHLTHGQLALTYTTVGPGETEGIECSNSRIYWVLRRCSWNEHGNSPLQKWTWGYSSDISSLAWPFSDLTLSP